MIALLPILSRVWPYLAGAALIIGAMLYLDHMGYARAQADRVKADAALFAKIDARLNDIDTALSGKVAAIDRTETIVKPTLIREINSAPRFSDPSAGISADMLRALNEARAASCPSGTDCGTVPAANANH